VLKKNLLLLVILVLVAPMILSLPAYAATEGSVTGTFTVNTEPRVDSISLMAIDDATPTTPTAMSPQVTYTVSVQVSDADTINDLSSVVLKLYYDTDGSTSETEFDSKLADSNGQNTAVITWTADEPGGNAYTGSIALQPSGSSWRLGSCILPQGGDGHRAGDFGSTTFTFHFAFTVGKTAAETEDSAKWQIAARATDRIGETGWKACADGTNMNFYGEIVVLPASGNGEDIEPEPEFVDMGLEKTYGVRVGYVANGAYDRKIRPDSAIASNSNQIAELRNRVPTYIISKRT